MKNAILIYGWAGKTEYYDTAHPTGSNAHWLPWLSKQLIVRDIHPIALEMPRGYYPEYDVWKRELERCDITPETILVGHSCGGGFLVRWLSESDIKVGRVVLVAPWLGYQSQGEPFDKTFFEFTIDRGLAGRTESVHVVYSTDDMDSVGRSVKEIVEGVDNVALHKFEGKGHFTLKSLGGEAFPELLEILVGAS